MKITPIDIQQMVFQVKFRGYDRDEVNRFLEELALTVENANRENSLLREKLTATEQQVTDLRRTEATLSNTLVSAQALAEVLGLDIKELTSRIADPKKRFIYTFISTIRVLHYLKYCSPPVFIIRYYG